MIEQGFMEFDSCFTISVVHPRPPSYAQTETAFKTLQFPFEKCLLILVGLPLVLSRVIHLTSETINNSRCKSTQSTSACFLYAFATKYLVPHKCFLEFEAGMCAGGLYLSVDWNIKFERLWQVSFNAAATRVFRKEEGSWLFSSNASFWIWVQFDSVDRASTYFFQNVKVVQSDFGYIQV